eukprot:3404574-Rhodomonas_salina.1
MVLSHQHPAHSPAHHALCRLRQPALAECGDAGARVDCCWQAIRVQDDPCEVASVLEQQPSELPHARIEATARFPRGVKQQQQQRRLCVDSSLRILRVCHLSRQMQDAFLYQLLEL